MRSRKRINQKRKDGGRAFFRLLGLNRGECRAHVIRSAAEAMSISLTNDEAKIRTTTADEKRAKIAIATYRLLDPRERTDLYERVQLAYPIDRDDLNIPQVGPTALVDRMVHIVPSRPKSKKTVELMKKPVIRAAIKADLPADELTIDEKRELVRMLRESEESKIRGLSPLGWIKSRLGM